MIFKNLLGLECYTESDKTIEYSNDIINLFTDPISLDYLKIPILLVDNPFNIYEYENILEWFGHSNIEPILGTSVNSANKYCILNNFIYAMMLLEYNNDKLYFHQPNIDLLNYINLVNHAFENKYKKNKKNEENKKYRSDFPTKLPLEDNLMYLDLNMYLVKYDPNLSEWEKYVYCDLSESNINLDKETCGCVGSQNNKVPLSNYLDFTLEDLLINDLYTGKRITKPIITANHQILDEETVKLFPRGYRVGTVEELTSRGDKLCDTNILFKKILEYFPNNNLFKLKDFNTAKGEKLCPMYNIFNDEKTLGLRKFDFYLSSTSTHEYIYNNYLKLLEDISNGKYPNFERNKTIISDYIKNNNEVGKESYGSQEGKVEYIRNKLNFPVVSHYDVYSDDFSLLDLSHCEFDKKCCGKGREYIGTNLKNTKFKNCEFSVCSFIATELENTIFENCTFKESVFFKTCLKNTQFVKCNFDQTYFKNTMDGTILNNCVYDKYTVDLLNKFKVTGIEKDIYKLYEP